LRAQTPLKFFVNMSIVISNISPQLSREHLLELFNCCGTIKTVEITDTEPKVCNITYTEENHAKAAVFLSGTQLGDRPLQVALKSDFKLNSVTKNTTQVNPIAEMLRQQQLLNPQVMNLTTPLLVTSQKRLQEIARTVYVGNVGFNIGEKELIEFFSCCGRAAHIKMAGDTIGKPARFAFIEFDSVEAAQKALCMSGSILGGVAIKVGKANNPIYKPVNSEPTKNIDEIMKKVRQATQKIDKKVENGGKENSDNENEHKTRHRSRSAGRKSKQKKRSRSRNRSRSRSRSRNRRRNRRRNRSRSRSTSRRRRRRRSRSRSRDNTRRYGAFNGSCYNCGDYGHMSIDCRRKDKRSYYSKRSKSAERPMKRSKKPQPDRTGQFFDGHRWQLIDSFPAAMQTLLNNQTRAATGPSRSRTEAKDESKS